MGMTRSVMSAMHNAIENTYIYPDHIIVDGNYFKELPLSDIDRGSYSYTTVIGGDNLYYSIAAASVIAKVEHDKYIHELCILHPILKEYDIDNNKGYELDNCVSCCDYCNRMKLNYTTLEFAEKISKIYSFFIVKQIKKFKKTVYLVFL